MLDIFKAIRHLTHSNTKINMHIDELLKEDIPAVCDIANSCFTSPWSPESFSEEMDNPRAVCFVARDNDKVVGYLSLWVVLDEVQINSFAVSESFRKQGIGSQLMNHAIDYAQKNHLKTMTLEVRLSNETAQKVYKKHGFLEAGVRPEFYVKPTEDALIMTKTFSEVHYL